MQSADKPPVESLQAERQLDEFGELLRWVQSEMMDELGIIENQGVGKFVARVRVLLQRERLQSK